MKPKRTSLNRRPRRAVGETLLDSKRNNSLGKETQSSKKRKKRGGGKKEGGTSATMNVLVVRVDIDQIVDRMVVGVGIMQRGAERGGGDGGGGRGMIDRLHRGNGRHLIGGTGRHLVHGIGRGHRAP